MRKGILGGLAVFALVAAPADAANVTVGCSGLQAALNTASAGEVVTLDQLCTSGFPYTLPKMPLTLTGTHGAGFDGGSSEQLAGGEASVTIEHLTFEDARLTGSSAGGVLSLAAGAQATSFVLSDDSFVNNTNDATLDGSGALIQTVGSVTVEDSTFNGDSASIGGGLRVEAGTAIFTDDTFSDDSADGGGGLELEAATAHLTEDTFEGNSAVSSNEGYGGGMLASFKTVGSTLSSSRFSNDTASFGGGGAAIFANTTGVGLTLNSDAFSHDSVADPGGTNAYGYGGGGLYFSAQYSSGLVTLAQSDDTFDSNTVSFKPAPDSSEGAGESVTSATLESVGDRFTNNTLQSPDATKNARMEPVFGWGAGLSVTECGDIVTPPAGTQNVTSTLADAVIAGNTLTSGPSANGAGIYVGVVCPSAYTTLDLLDSTVAGNVISGAGGPVAGISGGPHDVLSLANTIVYGDSGGVELGGFGSNLANVTASYSDVCSGTSPFAGTGNICADPQLVGPGPGSADVHEIAGSPTLGAGSNALIPSGLATDAYGNPRISGPIGCSSSPAPIVDIGAAQFVYPRPSCPPSTSPPRPPAPRTVHKQAIRAVIAANRIGNQLLQLIAPTACTASKALLYLGVRSIPQHGRQLVSYTISQVAFYINGGLKIRVLVGRRHHRRHKTVDEPQYQSKRLPSTFALLPSKIGAHPGANTVLVKITLVTHKGKGKHLKTLQVIRTLKSTFDVC